MENETRSNKQESATAVPTDDNTTAVLDSSPRRLRSKTRSGKKYRDLDFIYEEDANTTNNKTVQKVQLKERSASCSNLNLFAEPQPLKKLKKNNKQYSSDKKLSVNARSKSNKELEPWSAKQSKLRQQRIDLLFVDTAISSTLQDNSLLRLSTQQDLSGFESDSLGFTQGEHHNSQLSVADSFLSTSEYLNPEVSVGEPQLKETDIDSNMGDQNSGRTDVNKDNGQAGEEDWRTFLLKIKSEINDNTKDSIDKLREDFNRGLKELKDTQTTFRTDLTAVQTKLNEKEDELKTVKMELSSYKSQLSEVKKVTFRQGHMLKECQDKIETLHRQTTRDKLRIEGIKDNKELSAYTLVDQFFKNKLKIEQKVELSDAYKTGRGSYKTIVIQLQRVRDRGLIFGHVKNLKDLVNENKRPYSIKDHLTAKAYAAKMRQVSLQSKNKKLSAAETLVMNVAKSQFTIDGEVYKKEIKYPDCRKLLEPTILELAEQLQVPVTRGEEVTVEGQTFIGYTACVKSIEEVNAGYVRVVKQHLDARHVIGACTLPGRMYPTLNDFDDNDEHGSGAMLLDMLEKSDITNRAVYVVRYYDGTHIGEKRIDAILEAAHLAILALPFNKVVNIHQHPLTRAEMKTAHHRTTKLPKKPKNQWGPRVGGTVDVEEATEEATAIVQN